MQKPIERKAQPKWNSRTLRSVSLYNEKNSLVYLPVKARVRYEWDWTSFMEGKLLCLNKILVLYMTPSLYSNLLCRFKEFSVLRFLRRVWFCVLFIWVGTKLRPIITDLKIILHVQISIQMHKKLMLLYNGEDKYQQLLCSHFPLWYPKGLSFRLEVN